MTYLRVKQWDEFQHYRDRDPPWIKLYNRLLDDYEYGRLHDASKSHLIGIFLLASRHRNKIPADPKWIGRRIQATSKVDLSAIIETGIVEVFSDASECGADCEQDASNKLALARSRETEGEAETEVEREEEKSSCPEPDGSGPARVLDQQYAHHQARKALDEEPLIHLPTNKTDVEFPVTKLHLAEWGELYPAVDVLQEVRKMRGWLLSKPARRKTYRGMLAFVASWLGRAQDEAKPARASPPTKAPTGVAAVKSLMAKLEAAKHDDGTGSLDYGSAGLALPGVAGHGRDGG